MDVAGEVKRQFEVFYKQIDAFDYQKKIASNRRCFSFEMPTPEMANGKRKFFVAEVNKFWFWYKHLYSLPRHFYEIIQEGTPCRLYFDLEYKKADNPDVDEKRILSEFLQFVCFTLKSILNVDVMLKSFVLLDSTTSEKFSVHAICHFPNNLLFPNNVLMRQFILKLTEGMTKSGIGIIKNGKEDTFICDTAVYTKNWNFRIFLSSKCNKEAIFTLRSDCKFYDVIPNDERRIFFDSLIVPIDFQSSPILDLDDFKFVPIAKPTREPDVLQKAFRCDVKPKDITKIFENDAIEIVGEGTSESFISELDKYIIRLNLQYAAGVEIRNWTLIRLKCDGLLRMQYQLNHCRYCLRIQREHLSNNVYWGCQLNEEWIMQKCFDVECRNFTSKPIPIPSTLDEKIKPKLDLFMSDKPFANPRALIASSTVSTQPLHESNENTCKKRGIALPLLSLPKIPRKSIE